MVILFVALLLLLLAGSGSKGGRVLVYPVDGSHWLNMRILVEALHTQGHQVTVLRSSTSWYVSEHSPHYSSITVHQDTVQNIESEDFMSSFLHRSLEIRKQGGSPLAFLALYSNLFHMLTGNHMAVAHMARTMLKDQALMQRLREACFDLVLTDPVFPLGVLVAQYLQLPLVLNVRWIPHGEGHFAIAPS
ncbi:hypothetical protein SKAU_G00101590, partial [Synaphobranchus kaupii]